ncbi:MAG: hypothetical protein DRJ18_01870 [Candidatus Methanomethylicota archaeon]|nr:MAG: hypothetical protein DRJ18_01870 [Candidatus Verstraetearchaeota archaeon]
MGFSVSLSSAIVIMSLTVFLIFSAAILFVDWLEFYAVEREYSGRLRCKLDALIELEISGIYNNSVNLLVRNVGARTIFLVMGNYSWCSVVISYYDDGGVWRSYLIDDYGVLWVRVSSSNVTFSFESHSYINPGEEALIEVYLPNGASRIPVGSVVIAVFATHYGTVASAEGVRKS